MLLHGAIGDAYGAGFEFEKLDLVYQDNQLKEYRPHPLFNEIKGRYTDDTQMSIAIAELIISGKDWTPLNITDAFVTCFKRDQRKGYAKRFYHFLDEISTGQEFLEKIIATSDRNGSAMRAYVLGYNHNIQEILHKTKVQAQVTHNTHDAILASQAIALCSHYFIYQISEKKNLLAFLSKHTHYHWKSNKKGKVSMNAIDTVEAVLTVLLSSNSLKEILKMSVNYGGDVDTVASLALAIESQHINAVHDLPDFLFDKIENGKYGKDYLLQLDHQLKIHFDI